MGKKRKEELTCRVIAPLKSTDPTGAEAESLWLGVVDARD